jgi:hypothetical protein
MLLVRCRKKRKFGSTYASHLEYRLKTGLWLGLRNVQSSLTLGDFCRARKVFNKNSKEVKMKNCYSENSIENVNNNVINLTENKEEKLVILLSSIVVDTVFKKIENEKSYYLPQNIYRQAK